MRTNQIQVVIFSKSKEESLKEILKQALERKIIYDFQKPVRDIHDKFAEQYPKSQIPEPIYKELVPKEEFFRYIFHVDYDGFLYSLAERIAKHFQLGGRERQK